MKLFLRTLEQGMIGRHVEKEIRYLLKSNSTQDEELISAVAKASALEEERSNFQRSKLKCLK